MAFDSTSFEYSSNAQREEAKQREDELQQADPAAGFEVFEFNYDQSPSTRFSFGQVLSDLSASAKPPPHPAFVHSGRKGFYLVVNNFYTLIPFTNTLVRAIKDMKLAGLWEALGCGSRQSVDDYSCWPSMKSVTAAGRGAWVCRPAALVLLTDVSVQLPKVDPPAFLRLWSLLSCLGSLRQRMIYNQYRSSDL